MRKKYSIAALLMVCLMYIMLCGYTNEYDSNENKVYDNAGLLTEDQISELQSKCVSVAEKTKLDVVILTTNDAEGKNSTAYADDFYDENGFGYDQGGSGIMMLIDMDKRNVWLSTKGIAIEYFNDDDIDDVLDDVFRYMGEDNRRYDMVCDTFLDDVSEHVDEINSKYYSDVKPWFEGNYTDYEDYRHSNDYVKIEEMRQNNNGYVRRNIFSSVFVDLCVSIVVALVVVLIMSYSQKSKMTADGNTYMNKNDLIIHGSRDMFLRTTVTKTKIERDSGGSGHSGGGHSGGSTHRSSSGSSHGGGGRSF